MEKTEIIKRISDFDFWYHKIDLGNGVVTPGENLDRLWDMIRGVRNKVKYSGKKVLDIGSWDGMWSFEAEKLEAERVVSTDCHWNLDTYNKFLLCREILNSNVIPYFNVAPHNLLDRLDVLLIENSVPRDNFSFLFDIIQHFGVLYHLRDPLLSLSQCRSVIKNGGYLLLETAVIDNETESYMRFNGTPGKYRIYQDGTTWWAPTIKCLKEMLKMSLFEPMEETIQILPNGINQKDDSDVTRVCLVAKAIGAKEMGGHTGIFKELSRSYRNPGLAVEHIVEK